MALMSMVWQWDLPLFIRVIMLMCHKVTQWQNQMTATIIPKIHFEFSIDFNNVYVILNIVKANKKGELNWR